MLDIQVEDDYILPALFRMPSNEYYAEPIVGDQQQEEAKVQIETKSIFCNKKLKCGHSCKGFPGEKRCMPCLNADCCKENPGHHFSGITEDELCTICYTSELGEEPCTKLSCGHVFHTDCLVKLLQHKWPTLRITFAFMQCPSCNQEIKKEGLPRPILEELGPLLSMKKQVEKDALKVAGEQGILFDDRLADPNDVFYGKDQEYANHRCSYYQCFKCKKPYFGGLIDCEQEAANAQMQNRSKEDLFCSECLSIEVGEGKDNCDIHGTAFIDYKCNYCCSIALFKCFGTTYMCNYCHDRWQNPDLRDCGGVNCPLGVKHPPPSKDYKKAYFALGCSLCRSEKISNKNKTGEKIIKIERPDVEIEFPILILRANELYQQQESAQYYSNSQKIPDQSVEKISDTIGFIL